MQIEWAHLSAKEELEALKQRGALLQGLLGRHLFGAHWEIFRVGVCESERWAAPRCTARRGAKAQVCLAGVAQLAGAPTPGEGLPASCLFCSPGHEKLCYFLSARNTIQGKHFGVSTASQILFLLSNFVFFSPHGMHVLTFSSPYTRHTLW